MNKTDGFVCTESVIQPFARVHPYSLFQLRPKNPSSLQTDSHASQIRATGHPSPVDQSQSPSTSSSPSISNRSKHCNSLDSNGQLQNIIAAEIAAERNSRIEAQPRRTDASQLTNFVRNHMRIDFEGAPVMDLINGPARPPYRSTVAEWIINTTERRYEFLCNLDDVIRSLEMLARGENKDEEAKRKAKNRKKALAKKASKQRKEALGENQAEGDNEGGKIEGSAR